MACLFMYTFAVLAKIYWRGRGGGGGAARGEGGGALFHALAFHSDRLDVALC